jgi:4-amino-4-deoxy-L-arabinose transferase-like glycosyltransferase
MTPLSRPRILSWSVLILTAVVGMSLRLAYLIRAAPWTDEFFTWLAIQTVTAKGLPILPSGLFYTHGLPHIYAGAVLARPFGVSLVTARLPSLLISLPTLLLIYHLGRRWFSARVGFLAALLLALSPEAIEWGGQARMYAMWQFFTLAAVYLLFEGLLRDQSTPARVLGLLALSGAILCHLRTLLTIPALVLGLALAWWPARRQKGYRLWRPRNVPWAEVLALATVLVSPLIFVVFERPIETAGFDQIQLTNWINPIRLFADVLIGAQQFVIFPYLVFTVFALAGSLALLLRLIRRQAGAHDPALLFLSVTGLVVLLEFSLVSPVIVRIPRYLFDILPLYFLVVARELDFLATEMQNRVRGVARTATAAIPMLLVVVLFARPALATLEANPSAFQQAYGYVRSHWQPGDRVATPVPTVAYMTLGHCDFFVALENPLLWSRTDGPVDPHLGLPWIGTAEGLRQAANGSSRLWIVIDKKYAHPYPMIFGDRLTTAFQELDVVVYLVEREK